MKGIIPTGGRGTRMQPLTFSTNKHFIPIANKPLIHYPIEAMAEAGIKEVLITYNPGWLDYVKEKLGNGSKWGFKFTYVLQEEPKGLANIFQICEKKLKGEEFVLHLGDNIFTEGISKHAQFFLEKRPSALLMMVKVKKGENTRMGVPHVDKNGKLKKYEEKPKKPLNDFGIPGLYFFNNNVFKCFRGLGKIKPSARGELEISSPYNWLVKRGFRVDVVEYEGKWLDPGKFGDWIEANRFLLDTKLETDLNGRIDKSTKVEGRVSVGKGCKITKSEVRGPVSIGNSVTIANSYIGPYSSIADKCRIENSHVENSVLMEGVKVLNIKQPIDESLIGAGAEIIDENGPTDRMKLFIGEKSRVRI